MASDDFKYVAIKFERLTDADETVLRAFINRELAQKKITVDDADTDEKKKREAFRVRFRDMHIKAVSEATQKVPQQEFEAMLDDLSVGGCCVGLPKSLPMTKGGTIYLTLHFCQPALSMRGVILGLRRD